MAEQNRKENENKAYKGKQFDTYGALQYQRKLERAIRKQRQDIELLKKSGADPDDITAAKCRLQLTNKTYVDFSKEMGLRQQGERLRIAKDVSISKHGASGMAAKSDCIQWYPKGNKIGTEDYKDLMSYARKNGIELSGFKFFDGDVKTIKDLIDDANSVAECYPLIKNGNKKLMIMLDETMDSRDFAITRGHIVSINANAFRDTKMLDEEYGKLEKSGFFVTGTDYHSIIKHETGHVVANRYCINGLEIAKKLLESIQSLK